MRAGNLRHKLEIQENTPTRNAVGEEVDSWTTVATVWASIEPLSGVELLNAQQVAAETTVRIGLRYRSGVTAAHRIKFGARIFDINVVSNVGERNRELQLLCKEAA